MFEKQIYVERRKKLIEQLQSGVILLLGNDESPMNYTDNPFHFRQDSTFLYYFGLDYPGLAAVIDADAGKEIVFGNELTIDDIVWMGNQPTLKDRSLSVGVDQTAPANMLHDVLRQEENKNRKIHFLPPYRPENSIKIFNLLDIHPLKINESVSVDLIKAVVEQRALKSQEEIDELDKAVSISADMHITAMKMAKPGKTEQEITAAVQEVAVKAGGQLAFPIIATVNGETLHNHYHGNTLKSGDMFLLDAGAETSLHYAGDLSSTVPVDPTFTEKQKVIFNIALSAHQAGVKMLKPGIKFKDVHLTVCRTIGEGLREIGLMKGDINEAVNEGAHAMFFPCGTGHMMGLDVHDMEDLGEVYVGYEGQPKSTLFGLKSLRLARELKPGFVITVEPGIYFIPQLIDMWKAEKKFEDFINYEELEKYRDFGGLRNEEDFLITENGARLLGKYIPTTVEEIEEIKNQ
jgi:Xaa-Pro aminopeptidase